jgi:hypothetical protein
MGHRTPSDLQQRAAALCRQSAGLVYQSQALRAVCRAYSREQHPGAGVAALAAYRAVFRDRYAPRSPGK